MTVFCPTWLPIYIDGVIGGDLNTAASPGRFWQLHFVWRSDDFSQLIHIVFEGYAPGTWPHRCGGAPCYGGRDGTETLGGHKVTWYTRNRGSSTGHIAAVFRDGGNTYVVSLHVFDPYTAATAKVTVARIVTGLVPVKLRGSQDSVPPPAAIATEIRRAETPDAAAAAPGSSAYASSSAPS